MAGELRNVCFVGQEIDWNAPPGSVGLFLELPFWLLAPDCGLTLEIQGRKWSVQIISEWFEWLGSQVDDSKIRSVKYMGYCNTCPSKAKQEATSIRKCKTVVGIESSLNQWVIDHMNAPDDQLYDLARMYVKAWCTGHLEIVNELIRSYRLATYDCQVYELSPKDAVAWSVLHGSMCWIVVPYPYNQWDVKPVLVRDSEESEMQLANGDKIVKWHNREGSPGEMELVDATGLLERGDYSSAVRRARTALEVIITQRLHQTLARAHGEAYAEQYIASKRDRFGEILDALRKMEPNLFTSHDNDLLTDLQQVRAEIVHHGRRLGPADCGEANRLVNWSRFLYNKLEDNPERFSIRESSVAQRGFSRIMPFSSKLTANGVEVISAASIAAKGRLHEGPGAVCTKQ